MTGYEVYRYYVTVQQHYTVKSYNMLTDRAIYPKVEQYKKRHDWALFETIGKKFTDKIKLLELMIANYAYAENRFIYNYSAAVDNLDRWIKVRERISMQLSEDCGIIVNESKQRNISFDKIFHSPENGYPLIFSLYWGGQISIESICILDSIYNFTDTWCDYPTFYLIENDVQRIQKTKPFVKYSKEKISKILNEFENAVKLNSSHGNAIE